jgi:hypothetical protein
VDRPPEIRWRLVACLTGYLVLVALILTLVGGGPWSLRWWVVSLAAVGGLIIWLVLFVRHELRKQRSGR